MKVRLLDYRNYVGRRDVKTNLWFAMDNDFLTTRKHFKKLTPNAVTLFVYIASECTKMKSAELEISEEHVTLYCLCDYLSVKAAIEILKELQLIQVSDEEHGRDTPAPRPPHGELVPRDLSATGRKVGRKEGERGNETENLFQENTYVYDEAQKPKKVKQPKPELSCEAVPELLEIKEILENRKIATLLQEKWLKLYRAPAIVRGVEKADTWAISNKVVKKNWGQFFNNWLSRDCERGTAPLSASANEKPKSEAAPRKKTWWEEQQELKDKGLPNGIDGSFPPVQK